MNVTATIDAAPASDGPIDEVVTQFSLAMLRREAEHCLDTQEPMGRFQSVL